MKKDITNLHFKNMTEEIQFWDSVDLGEYLTKDDVENIHFPKLKTKLTHLSPHPDPESPLFSGQA